MRYFCIIMVLTACPAYAQVSSYYDAKGHYAGSSYTFGDHTQYYDYREKPAGESETFVDDSSDFPQDDDTEPTPDEDNGDNSDLN